MSRPSGSSDPFFGYLTAIESAEHGYFGGYLVVSHLGRPLEFHCTAPIRPSRAQQILYGPTLEPYLLGEQISGALLNVAKLAPCIILTDCEATLHARERFAAPMAMLLANRGPTEPDEIESQGLRGVASNAVDLVTKRSRPLGCDFTFGGYNLQHPVGYERDEHDVIRALTILSQHVDLAEPFARIRDAIREAQRIGGRGTEAHDQAA